jgi:hypothetical protein
MHPLAHRGGVDAEEARHLARVQLLEVAEHEGLAVEIRQLLQGGPRLLRQELFVQEVVGPARRPELRGLRRVLPFSSNRGRYSSSDSVGRRRRARRCIKAAFVVIR